MNNKKLLVLSLAGLLSVGSLTSCNKEGKLAKELVEKLVITSDAKQATGNFKVPSKISDGTNEYSITWTEESDYLEVGKEDEKTASYTVKVTRPKAGEGNKDYTLTAEVDVNGKKASKDFKGTITQAEPVFETTKVGDILDHTAAHFGKDCSITGTVITSTGAGLWILGEDGRAIFTYGKQGSIKPGDKVTATGKLDVYNTLYQLKEPSVNKISSGDKVSFPAYTKEVITPAELTEMNIQKGDAIHGTKFKIKGVVNVVKNGEFEDYYMQDIEDQSIKHQFYYKSITKEQKDLIKAINGKVAEIEVVYYTNHGDKAYLDYIDGREALEGRDFTDTERFTYNASGFANTIPATIAGNLPKVFEYASGKKDAEDKDIMTKANVSYESNNKEVITDKGYVNVKPTPTQVKFKATITLGEGEDKLTYTTDEIEVTVGIDKFTKASAIVADSKKEIKTAYYKGEILMLSGSGYYITYEDGKYYPVNSYNKPLEVGKTVTLKCGFGEYKSTTYINNYSTIDQVATETAHVVDYSKAVAIDQAALVAAIGDGVAEDKVATTEGFKPVLDNMFNLIKIEGEIINDEDGLTLKADGFFTPGHYHFKHTADQIKGLKAGDKVVAYGVCNGAYVFNGNVRDFNGYAMKIEKKAA